MKKLEFKNQLSKMIKDFDNYEDFSFGRQLATLTGGLLQTQTQIDQEDETTTFIAIIKNPKHIPTIHQVNEAIDWGSHCVSPPNAATVTHTPENHLKITWNNAGHI